MLRCNVPRARTSLNTSLRCAAEPRRGETSHVTRPFTALGVTKQGGFWHDFYEGWSKPGWSLGGRRAPTLPLNLGISIGKSR